MFVMWLGEKITDKGIGNGISLIIMIGIIARLPFALVAEFGGRLEQGGARFFPVRDRCSVLRIYGDYSCLFREHDVYRYNMQKGSSVTNNMAV